MALKEDLQDKVAEIFGWKSKWETRQGQVVPQTSDVALGNEAVEFDTATILYADLDGSTAMVDQKFWWFSGEVYKSYLHCAGKIVTAEGGEITAYDGDRIMAVFIGESPNSRAAYAALKLNWAVKKIINPEIKRLWPKDDFDVKHNIGIDRSVIRAARTGVRGNNDLVWIGRAANYAAKLTELAEAPLWVTKDVYDRLGDHVKKDGAGKDMWEKRTWTKMNNMAIYCSHYMREV